MRKEALHSSVVKHLASMNEQQLRMALSCVEAIERQDSSVWQKLKPEALENVYSAYHDSFSETNLVSEPDLNALSAKWREELNGNKQH
jgi:hypothetical protein